MQVANSASCVKPRQEVFSDFPTTTIRFSGPVPHSGPAGSIRSRIGQVGPPRSVFPLAPAVEATNPKQKVGSADSWWVCPSPAQSGTVSSLGVVHPTSKRSGANLNLAACILSFVLTVAGKDQARTDPIDLNQPLWRPSSELSSAARPRAG